MTQKSEYIPDLGIDESKIQEAMKEAEGDIFEFAQLLAKQVDAIDDEDDILPEQDIPYEEEECQHEEQPKQE